LEPRKLGGGAREKKGGMGRRLSQAELEERSRKGLCFKCGEKWGPEHVCKMKHFQLVLVEGEDEEEAEEKEDETENVKVDETEMEFKTLQLSLKSKEGLTSNNSFKTWGHIGGRQVLMLIDCGATSNFISKELVQELQLPVKPTPEFVVEVGNGDKISNRGVCKDLQLEVQGLNIVQNFFLLDLGGTEVVLGMEWLASLGDVEANFKNLTIKWGKKGNQQVLIGDPSLSKAQTAWKALIKAIQDDGDGFYVACKQPSLEENQVEEIPESFAAILTEFDDVFQVPQGLPPKRVHDHSIISQDC